MNEASDFPIEKWVAIYNREIRNRLSTILKPYNMHESNFYYVLIVIENPGVSQKDLVTYIRREQSIVTKAIKPLIRDGWLEMCKDPQDKRQTQIFPTEKALNIYPELTQALLTINKQVSSGLDEHERQELLRLLQKATNHLI